MDKENPIYKNLQRFANDLKVIFEDNATIGIGRPCVGFSKGNCFIAHNPTRYAAPYTVEELADGRLRAPKGVSDDYHKGNYLAVLVHNGDYDEALRQLNVWVEHLESLGTVTLAEYATGATGLQAEMSGRIGYAIKIKESV